MSRSINQYRIHCVTENKDVYNWNNNITCPNDHTHQIDINSVSIFDTISSDVVTINQSNPIIPGNWRVENDSFTVLPGEIYTSLITFKYPTGALTLNWTSYDIHAGDIINGYVGENTTIGIITQSISPGDTIYNVSPSVLKHLNLGFLVNITNGTQNIQLGECIKLDTINNTITCSIPCNISLSSHSLVQMTIWIIRDIYITGKSKVSLGVKHLNSDFLPANIINKFTYQNNGSVSKTFSILYDILY